MYGPILRQLREATGRSQADVARSVGISAAHLARLETNQRGLYLEDFVALVENLGEKPGNLLPNDLGALGYMKPLINRLSTVAPHFLARLTAVIDEVVYLTEDVAGATTLPSTKPIGNSRRKTKPSPTRKGRS